MEQLLAESEPAFSFFLELKWVALESKQDLWKGRAEESSLS